MKIKIFFILLLLICIALYNQKEETIIIPDASIRLRVIPNSNNPEDIYIKEKVKKYLEENVVSITKNIDNIDEMRNLINQNIPSIEKDINNIFIDNNYKLPYNVNYGSNYFPEKIYKGISYEEGYYESLVISIGEAEGDNFWCVLFPNLCLVDSEKKTTYKSYLKELINKIF